MITTSDIVKDIILSRGYANFNDFATRNKLEFTRLYKSYKRNSWTISTLAKISQKVGTDLTGFATANAEREELLE